MQEYLSEMAEYYGDQPDADGRYPYRYLPLYFTDDDRSAYFIYDDTEMIGFALINAYSLTGEIIRNCIAEFTIFPEYRNKGMGMKAIAALKEGRSGKWQLKFSMQNKPARRFWTNVKDRFDGAIIPLSENENIVEFE